MNQSITEMNYLENPVFICGHRKTGTTMLVNLFDGNDDAMVYPDDSTFFYMYYPRYESEKYTDEERLERLGGVIVNEVLSSVIDRTNCSDEEKNILHKKRNILYNKVKEFKGEDYSISNLLPFYIEAFRSSFYPEISPKIWIEKTTSTEIYALELSKIFPNAKFIHILRDPRDNWASLSSGWEKRYKHYNDELNRLKHSMIERGKLGMRMAKDNLETIGKERYRVIKFEDITSNPVTALKNLCNFIGITFDEDMLTPSTFGYKWKGNNFEGVKHDEPSTINVNRWKERISDEDAKLIEFHFRNIMKHFGYKTEHSVEEQQEAAAKHYKWYNFSTPYSAK